MTRRSEALEDLAKAIARQHALELALARAEAEKDSMRQAIEDRGERIKNVAATIEHADRRVEELEAKAATGYARLVRERIVVNLVDGSAFIGLLWDDAGPLVLRDAVIAGPSPQPVDGEVIIDLTRVAWVQVPTPG